MIKGILGRKIGMTQIFEPNGTATGVTVLQAGPCTVTQSHERPIKTAIVPFKSVLRN